MGFYRRWVVQNLGPRPTSEGKHQCWQSFMTDDFSPVEFSWNWGKLGENAHPKIRFSIEAIGYKAGTKFDPWNYTATLDLITDLRLTMPSIDCHWSGHLLPYFLPSNKVQLPSNVLETHGYKSTVFIGFELVGKEPMLKIYMLPLIKALQLGFSVSTVICDALESLPTDLICSSPFHQLSDFLKTKAPQMGLEPFMVAIDCVAPSLSRLKVYARCQDTTFESVEAIMSNFDSSQSMVKAIMELRHLWELTLFFKEHLSSGHVTRSNYTSGILYYFEIRDQSEHVTPKVYLPVKHYGRNDLDIATGLGKFLKAQRGYREDVINNYLKALHKICKYRELGSASGLQTYISCSIKDGVLDITSYLSPEVYHKGRLVCGL